MSDPISVAVAYTIVLGGLSLYLWSIVRRAQAAGRVAAALERERALDGRAAASGSVTHRPEPVEPR